MLQDGGFARVGSNKMIHRDVRIIAATNRNLEAAIRARQFREDVFYPPLLHISYETLRHKIVDCGLARRGSANAGMMIT